MKRLILFWGLTILTFCSLWAAKDKPITPSLYINGTIIRDYGDIHSGTPALLVCVVKHKMVEPEEEPYMVALLINDDWQLIPLDEWEKYFRPDSVSKKDFWKLEQLKIVEYFDKKGMREKLRWEQKQEADQYILELEKSELFYDDAAIEDYLQCALLDIFPQEQLIKREEGVPIVRILKSSAPDIMMLANHTLLISTGMLAILDSEDELYALLSREVAHYINDHALITVAKNIARAKRAVFWGAVMDGVVEATEQYLYERYDYYEPGLVFATNDLIQALVNQNIANRMGLDYSKEQEQEADDIANRYMSCIGRHTDALASALHKLNNYYQYEKDMEALNKYGIYGTLEERVSDMEISSPLPKDRIFLKRMRSIVSFEATMQDYNKLYKNSYRMAMKNIDNLLAAADDYLLVARSLMKQSNTPESNEECWLYLEKADMIAEVKNVNVTKMKILLKLRTNEKLEAVALLKHYQSLLDILYQQPHTEEDAQWIASEQMWAEKLLERLYLI